MNTRLTILALVWALLIAPLAMAQTYYKWTDENGTVHFTEEPPADREYETVNTSGQITGSSPTPANAPPPAGEQDKTEAQMPREAAPDPEVIAARCKQARENLFWLQSKRRIVVENDDGSETFASPEKQQEMIEENQALIDEWCEEDG